MTICLVLTSSLLASCAQKQRVVTETKPKITVNAVTNTPTKTDAKNNSMANNNKQVKITLPKKITSGIANNNNNNYVPENQSPITAPIVDEYVETTQATREVTKATTVVTNAGGLDSTTSPVNQDTKTDVTTETNSDTTSTTADNSSENPVATDFKEKDKVILSTEVKVYASAQDAISGENPVKAYGEGNYYVYKVNPDGAINISKDPNQPGGWIKSGEYLASFTGENSPETTTKAENPATTSPEEEKIPLGTKVYIEDVINVYKSAEDALNKKNVVKTYEPGEYYVVKYSDGAVNISKTKDQPGAWISPEIELVKATEEAPASGKIEIVGDGTVKITGKVKVYSTAEDAKKKVNSTNSYESGSYFIYKEADGMINISKTQGSPGAWVNPDNDSAENTSENTDDAESASGTTDNGTSIEESDTTLEDVAIEVPEVTEETNGNTNNNGQGSVTINGDSVKLNESISVYGTAYDAMHKINPINTYKPGDYFVFKESDGMYNITSNQGAPGGWINPGATQLVNNGGTEGNPISEEDKSTNSDIGTTIEEGGTVVAEGDGYDTVEGGANELPAEAAPYFKDEPYKVVLNFHGMDEVKSATIDHTYTREEINIKDDTLANNILNLLNNGQGFSDGEYSFTIQKVGTTVGALNISFTPVNGAMDNVVSSAITEAFANMSYPAGSGNGYGSVTKEISALLSKANANKGTMYGSFNGNIVMKVLVNQDGKATIRIGDFNVN